MAEIGTLSVKLDAATQAFNRAMSEAEGKLNNFAKVAEAATKTATVAFAGLTAGSIAYVKAAGAQQEAEIRLANAIKATGSAVDASAIKAYASELQGLTHVGDEVSIASAATLVQFGLQEDQIKRLLPLMHDADAAGLGMAESAKALGKAIQKGEIGPLEDLGVVFNETEMAAFKMLTETERAEVLMERMGKTIGGTAAALAGTGAKSFDGMTGALGDLNEQIGFILEPGFVEVMQSMTAAIGRVTSAIAESSPEMKSLVARVVGATTAFSGLVAASGAMALAGPKIAGAFSAAAKAIQVASKASLALGKNIVKLAAVAIPVASAVGAIGAIQEIALGGEEGRQSVRQRYGIGEDAGLGETFGKVLMGTIDDGFTPLVDAMKAGTESLQSFFEPIDSSDVVTKVAESSEAATAALDKFSVSVANGAKKIEESTVMDFGGGPGGFDTLPQGATSSDLAGSNIFGDDSPFADLERELAEDAARRQAGLDEANMAWDSANKEYTALGTKMAEDAALMGVVTDTATGMLSEALGPKASALANAAAQGFAAGGPIGALVAALGTLLTMTESFGKITNILETLIGDIVGRLDPLVAAIVPIVEVAARLALLLVDLAFAFLLINPAIEVLATILGFVAKIINEIVEGIRKAFNMMIMAVAKVLEKIPGIGSDLARRVADARITTDIEGTMIKSVSKRQKEIEDDLADAANAANQNQARRDREQEQNDRDRLGNIRDERGTLNETQQALRETANIPSGFKVALKRFESTIVGARDWGQKLVGGQYINAGPPVATVGGEGTQIGTMPAAGDIGGPTAVDSMRSPGLPLPEMEPAELPERTNILNVDTMNVYANNPEEIADAANNEQEWNEAIVEPQDGRPPLPKKRSLASPPGKQRRSRGRRR